MLDESITVVKRFVQKNTRQGSAGKNTIGGDGSKQ